MTAAVFFAFAVDPGASPIAKAAPPGVLSRQLPRLAVHLLNAEGDRGLRFFPFLGREGDRRRMLGVERLLPVPALMKLHAQVPPPRILVDGCLHAGRLRLRIHGGDDGEPRFDEDVPFDPREPLPAVSRIMVEVAGALGWPGAPPRVPALAGEALLRYLLSRDDLLGLEAGLIEPADARPSANALRALSLAPLESEVRDLVLEIWSRQAKDEGSRPLVAQSVGQGCVVANLAGLSEPCLAAFLTSAAAALEGCQRGDLALAQYERAASLCPSRADAACRAATLHFEAGRLSAAKHILRRTLDAGQRTPTVLAQLAVIEEQLGAGDAHAELVEELLGVRELPAPMVRIAVSYLLARDRADEALEVVEPCLRRDAGRPGPWFDRGRALAAVGRHGEAALAFEACLRLDPDPSLRGEAERHLRFARAPGVVEAMRAVDEALAAGDLRGALRRARRLVRGQPALAEAWLFLGVTLQRMARPRRAERALRRSVQLEPGLGEAHNRLGILLVGRGRHREGYAQLREAARLQPREPSVHLHLAQACHYLGLRREGEQALAQAERLGGARDAIESVRRSFF